MPPQVGPARHKHIERVLHGRNYLSCKNFAIKTYVLVQMWRRLDILRSILRLGYHVLFTDVDVAWLQVLPHFLPTKLQSWFGTQFLLSPDFLGASFWPLVFPRRSPPTSLPSIHIETLCVPHSNTHVHIEPGGMGNLISGGCILFIWQDPSKELHSSDADLQLASDTYHPEDPIKSSINCGFFFARSTPPSLAFFDYWIKDHDTR